MIFFIRSHIAHVYPYRTVLKILICVFLECQMEELKDIRYLHFLPFATITYYSVSIASYT